MDGILSQSEIDQLLSALSDGEEVASVKNGADAGDKGVRAYDFRTANKFSKEQMKTLSIIYDNFAYLLSTRLTGILRTVCEVKVLSVEEQLFGEFSNSISEPVVLGVVDMLPMQGHILYELSPAVVYAMIGRLLGGVADTTSTGKAFTEIETNIITLMLHKIVGYVDESWEKVIETTSTLSRVETSPQFTQITAANEPVALVVMNIKIDDVEDMLTLCIPHVTLQPIVKKLNSTIWTFGGRRHTKESRFTELITQKMENTVVGVQVVLDDFEVTFGEILNMRVGDILCVPHKIEDYVTVKLEHIPKFKGVLGEAEGKQAIQIAEIIKENYDSE